MNSNLFSGHYLAERIQYRDEWDCDETADEWDCDETADEWDCDETADEALAELQSLYELEGSLVGGTARPWRKRWNSTRKSSGPTTSSTISSTNCPV